MISFSMPGQRLSCCVPGWPCMPIMSMQGNRRSATLALSPISNMLMLTSGQASLSTTHGASHRVLHSDLISLGTELLTMMYLTATQSAALLQCTAVHS